MRIIDLARRLLPAGVLALALVAGPVTRAAAQQSEPTAAQHLPAQPLTILTHHGAIRFTVEVADTEQERETGLMFRTVVAPHTGMLFDFKSSQPVAFWMKNTLVPLDMLFITADGRVLSIAHDAVPEDETPIPSGGAVLGVLEIGGGQAAALDIEPGDRVRERIFRHD